MLIIFLRTFISALRSRRALALENPALHHQLEILSRYSKRPRLTNSNCTLWIILSRLWDNWRKPLTIVQPETVIRWHRRGFRLYWRWKSRPRWSGCRFLALLSRFNHRFSLGWNFQEGQGIYPGLHSHKENHLLLFLLQLN